MIRKSTNQLSIKPKLSKKFSLGLFFFTLLVSALALYSVYHWGIQSGHQQFEQDRVLIGQLNETIKDLRVELSAAEESKILAQRQQQIQEEAYRQMSSAYTGSEQKNRYLGSRLDFYRSIISPEKGQSGPAIQALDYQVSPGKVEFDVTLVQAIKHKHQVRGNLVVLFYDGEKVIGQWPSSGARRVNYQYFQQESGAIELTNTPDNIRALVKLSIPNSSVLERWYDIKADQLKKSGRKF